MTETPPKTEADLATAIDEEASLDPKDWAAFRALAHQVLDLCVDRLEGARERPWAPVSAAAQDGFAAGAPDRGRALEAVMADVARDVMPFATGNTHPRFFGWVHGTGTADGLLAAMVEAAMNSNCGGRDHGALYVEAQVIAWMGETFGFGAEAGGILVSGASMATLIGLLAARQRVREAEGGEVSADRLTLYVAEGAHAAMEKAFYVMGAPAANLRRIAADGARRMDLAALRAAIAADQAAGLAPLAAVGTVGAVETGVSDDLAGLRAACAEAGVWMHVDGAFGAWARLASSPWRERAAGLEAADSLAFDFHKWPSVNYDCGCALVRDKALHRRAFSNRPNYLQSGEAGLAGGDPWYCDYGIELSRGFRALKVWTALQTHGLSGIGRVVDKCCRQAALMAAEVAATEGLTLAYAPELNVVCFFIEAEGLKRAETDRLATRIAAELQHDGTAVFSTARIDGRMALRAAIVNHRTRDEDVALAVRAAAEKRSALIG